MFLGPQPPRYSFSGSEAGPWNLYFNRSPNEADAVTPFEDTLPRDNSSAPVTSVSGSLPA